MNPVLCIWDPYKEACPLREMQLDLFFITCGILGRSVDVLVLYLLKDLFADNSLTCCFTQTHMKFTHLNMHSDFNFWSLVFRSLIIKLQQFWTDWLLEYLENDGNGHRVMKISASFPPGWGKSRIISKIFYFLIYLLTTK